MDSLLSIEIWQGRTLADILTVDALTGFLGTLVTAVLILMAGYVIAGWVGRRVRKIGDLNAHLDATLFNFLASVLRYVIIGLTLLTVLNTFGVQTTSVIALLGAAGLAIGLALQGTLSNVAAGVMIIFFRPIKLGDFVTINNSTGTVRDITLNYTELTSLTNHQIIIPNAEVWGNTIENFSVNSLRRAEWVFGVSYGADLALAEKTIRDTIMADPRSFAEPEPFVQVNNLGDFSVDFLVRVWCANDDYFDYQADMKRLVKEALDAAGIEIPFPTRTVLQTAT